MPRLFRLLLAVLLGLVAGSAVNMGLVLLGGRVVAPPLGADVSTMEGLALAMPQFRPSHFVFPFLAHALGTLAGACVAALLAPGRSALPSWVVGGLFFLGGVANVVILPSPLWFTVLDLGLAYFPMAWLGLKLAARLQPAQTR